MKKSRFLSLVLTLSVLAALFLPVSASALEEPALNCTHAVLLDANYNEVLYEKGAYEKAYPASITKVMTALLEGEIIDLNTAAPEDLERLPGIGPAKAEAIAAYRTEHGPFRTVDQLMEVSGIGEATLEALRPYITASAPA